MFSPAALMGQRITGGKKKRTTNGGEVKCNCTIKNLQTDGERREEEASDDQYQDQDDGQDQDQDEGQEVEEQQQLTLGNILPIDDLDVNQLEAIPEDLFNKYKNTLPSQLDNIFSSRQYNYLYVKLNNEDGYRMIVRDDKSNGIYKDNNMFIGGYSNKRYKAYLEKMDVQRLYKIAKNKNIQVTVKRDGKTKYVKKDTIVKKLLDFHFSMSKAPKKTTKKTTVKPKETAVKTKATTVKPKATAAKPKTAKK